MRQTLLLASIAIGQIYATAATQQPGAVIAGRGNCGALPLKGAAGSGDYLLPGTGNQNFQVAVKYARNFLNGQTDNNCEAALSSTSLPTCITSCQAKIAGVATGVNQVCSYEYDTSTSAMACYYCPSSGATLGTGTYPESQSQDSTVFLACSNCNVNDFGPEVSSAPSFIISSTVSSTKQVAGLTQDYFFVPLSPPVPVSGNCATTLPSTAGTPYSCAWYATTAGEAACSTTTASSVMTIGAAPKFQATLTNAVTGTSTNSFGCYYCTHTPTVSSGASSPVYQLSKPVQVCNTQVTTTTPAPYTTAFAYGATAKTLGTTFPGDLFGTQVMTGCTIDKAYTGSNLKIVTTKAGVQTLEWTSSDLQQQKIATDVVVTCNDPCGKAYPSTAFTVTQNPQVCVPVATGKKTLTGITSLAIPVGIKTNVIYNTANFFFDFAIGSTCNQAGLQLGDFDVSPVASSIVLDSNKNILSVLPATTDFFSGTGTGIPNYRDISVTYNYWKTGNTGSTKTGTQPSNIFKVTQDCTQAPFADKTAYGPPSVKFEAATPTLDTYVAAASVRALFLNANCWTATSLPICTVTNTTATTAIFTIAKIATSLTSGLNDYQVKVTNFKASVLNEGVNDLSQFWTGEFSITCINKGDKATASSSTTPKTFTYNGCSTVSGLALSYTYNIDAGASTSSNYNSLSTKQRLFTIVAKTTTKNALFTVSSGFCPDISCHLVGNTVKTTVMSFASNEITSTLNSAQAAPAFYPNVTVWCKAPPHGTNGQNGQKYYQIQKQTVQQQIKINLKTVALTKLNYIMQAQPAKADVAVLTISSNVLDDYFNHIALTSPAFYSCTASGGTLTPKTATKAGEAQALTVASVLNTGQDLDITITCTNSALGADAQAVKINVLQTCFLTVDTAIKGNSAALFSAVPNASGTIYLSKSGYSPMFTHDANCNALMLPTITGCKATAAADGITVATNGDISYSTTSAYTSSVTLMGCADQNGTPLTGYVEQTIKVNCATSAPSKANVVAMSKSVTLGESISFDLIKTFYSPDAQCYQASDVTCESTAKPSSLKGVSTTTAAPGTITAVSTTVGFSESLQVKCTFTVTTSAASVSPPVTEKKEITSATWIIAQNCNPVANPSAKITSRPFAKSSDLSPVGDYTYFFTMPKASCYSGAKVSSTAGSAAYVIAPTCQAAMPKAGSGTFTITPANSYLVATNGALAGGFNRNFALQCTFPAAFIGTQQVIGTSSAQLIATSVWTTFEETCLTKVTSVAPITVAYLNTAKVPITNFFSFVPDCNPSGLSCVSSSAAVLSGGPVTTIAGSFSAPTTTPGGWVKTAYVTCSYGSGAGFKVVSNVATLTQKECSADVKSIATKTPFVYKKIVTPYVYGSAQASAALTLGTYFQNPQCIQDISTCKVASTNATAGVSLALNKDKDGVVLSFNQNITSNYTTQVTLTCGGVTSLNDINVTQNIAGPCATAYAKKAATPNAQVYIQGKSSGMQSVAAVSTMFTGMDGCAKNEGCTLGKAATTAGFSVKAFPIPGYGDQLYVINNWNSAGIKKATFDITCSYNLMTTDAKKVPSKSVPVASTFTWGYDACTTLAQSEVPQTAATFSAIGATYSPQGSSTIAFQTTPDYQSLFFANLNCPKVSGVSADPVAAAAGCDVTTITVANPLNGKESLFKTGAAPVKGAKTLDLKNDIQGGYNAQLSIGSCVPIGATAKFATTAPTTTYNQKCFQVLVAKPAVTNIKLTRGSGKKALFATGPALLEAIFTGYDETCNSITSVTSSQSACAVTTTQAIAVNLAYPTTPTYSTACALDTAAGYSGAVTVTVKQEGNPDYTSTYLVSLPAGASGGASSSKTTAVVLGVIGGVVGLGIIGGVAWYVIKGRGNGEVDPYDDDATTGLNQQEHA